MFKYLFNPRENCVEVTMLLVESLNAKVTFTTIEKRLTSHPNYPSAVSIGDLLDTLNINHISFTVTEDFLANVSAPFLTLVKSDQYHIDMYTFVKPISENQLQYFDPDAHCWETIDHNSFLSKWESNFVMLFEAEQPILEEDFKEILSTERRSKLYKFLTYSSLPLLSLIIIVMNIFFSGIQALYSSIFMVLTLAGCFVSSLLLSYDIDKYNPILKNICSKGKKVNCGFILNSKKAKIAGISWSAIGFTYFAGQLLLGLLYMLTNQSSLLTAIYITNALASPYIIYSISIQWIAKQWCPLCLMVQLLLALQFIVSISSGWHFIYQLNDLFQLQTIAIIVLAFSLPAIVLSMLMPNFLSAKEGKYSRKELLRLKHNPQIFDVLLKQQKPITPTPSDLGVKIGSGDNKIIKVCNPYCIPCSDAHKSIEELIRTNPTVEVQIIYWISPTEKASNIVKHFIAIEKTYGTEKLKEALDYWYLSGSRDYADFANKFPLDETLLKQEEALGLMYDWCNEEKISFTPTFYVNGFQIPSTYSVNDLKYLLAN